MSHPRPERVMVCIAVAATALALGACSRPEQGAARPSRAPGQHPSVPAGPPSLTTAARSEPRLRVRPAGFRLPVAFGREAVVSTGCDAVVGGGLVGGDSSIPTTYRIDLRQGRISGLPHLPVPVHDTAGALISHPLVIGGGNAAEQSVVQGWDGSRWRIIGHLPQPRSDLVAATVARRLVVAGGYNGTRPAEPDILGSTDGRRWTAIGTLPVPVRYPASTVAHRALWLFGGESAGSMQTAIQRLNPVTGRARLVARLHHPLGHAVAIPFGTRILVVGGRTSTGSPTDRMWWFDLHRGTITQAGRLPQPLSDSAVAHCGDSYYLLGGETPAVTDQVLEVTYW
jgi:N-acetylneuraminic acid mutarotase